MINIKKLIDTDEMVVAIGAYDAFSALMVERAGFDAVYVGSYITELSFLGKPDLSMMSKTDRMTIARNIINSVNIPVIVDGEEGYGNAINLIEMIKDFENMGAAGLHIDDQKLPSKCPFIPGTPYHSLISTDEMCGKIRAAIDTKKDPDFLIIVRSDVIATMSRFQYYEKGMKEVVRRSNKYAEAGADAIFIMALTEEELKYFRSKIDAPIVGIFAPVEPLALDVFKRNGCVITIGSIVPLYAAAKGLKTALEGLKKTGDWNAIKKDMIDDDEFFDIVQISKYQPLYKKYSIE